MKKVISIIAIALVALLVGATVALACIKTSSTDVVDRLVNYDDINYVQVYKDGAYYQSFTKSDDEGKKNINTIIDLHKKSLKENMLSALFQGALGFDATMETLDASVTRDTIVKDKNCIAFVFAEKQTLVWEGKTVQKSNNDVQFVELIMEVTDNENYSEVNVYVLNLAKNAVTSNSSLYKLTTIAHQDKLNDFITKLEFAGN